MSDRLLKETAEVSPQATREKSPGELGYAMIYWLALARSVHIGGSILLAAVFVFRLIVLLPATTSANRAADRLRLRLEGSFRCLVFVSWTAVIFSGLAWFMLVAASIGGEAVFSGIQLDTLEIILFRTQFGHLWLFRFGCCLVLGALLLIKRCESISAGLAILVLASLGGAGHAGANASSTGLVALAVDVGHLVFAALWPGGLVPLLLFLFAERRAAQERDLLARMVQRFSAMSLTAVIFLGVTGIINAYFLVGSLRALFETPYGQLLLIKIALFLLMIGFGAWNLLVLKPGLLRLAEADPQRGSPKFVACLYRNVACETVLAAGVLLIVGLLGVTAPPMH
jgi:putative copper resistance protein D